MTRLVKRLIGAAVGLLVLLVVVVVVAFLFVNSLARKGIESGATYALGVPTTLKGAGVGIAGGTLTLEGLNVANPQGFSGPHFLSLGDGKVAVSLGSLTKDTIVVPELRLSDVDVVLEKREGKSNYDVILANIDKATGGGGQPTPPKPGAKEKKLIINELVIRNVTVHADLLGLPASAGPIGGVANQATNLTIPIEQIRLTDVGKTGQGVAGSGVTISELSALIVEAVLAAAVEKGGNILPPDVVNGIRGELETLGAHGTAIVESAAGELTKITEKLPEGAGKAAEGAIQKGREGLEKLGGLKDLIPKKKQ